jgi:ribosomal protein S18 acetylase RimI-like enzyme
VLLWVDRANERAVELYTSRGFTTRWDDVAFEAVTRD